MNYDQIPSDEIINATVEALKSNGMTAHVVNTAAEAKDKVFSLIPKGAEVMTMTSITLEETGIADYLNNSGQYDSVRKDLEKMNRETDSKTMQRIGAAPDWSVGSVHSITQNGEVIIASNTGSQLPGYAYGSPHVVWVVGAQKIVTDIADGQKRLKEYVVPLESVRARKAYGLPDSFHTNISKLLIISREVNPERIQIVIVKEKLGY
jgi:hypothetical protein